MSPDAHQNSTSRYPLLALRRVIRSIEQGWSPSCSSYQADDGEWGVLKVGCVNGGRFTDSENKALPPELSPRRELEVQHGDILMSRANTKELLGSTAVAHNARSRLMLCDKLYRIHLQSDYHSPFFVWVMASAQLRCQFERDSSGASNSMQNIAQAKLLQFTMPVPPLSTQKAIADFLDRKTAAIDSLIEKKQKLLDLLAEKRAALINQAVTKGLVPSVPMQDSGILWIGEIPAHWEVRQVRRVLQRIEQGWSPLCENRLAEPGEWGVLKVGCVNGGRFRSTEHKALPSDLRPDPRLEVRDGDLLMSRANTSELVGSTAVLVEPWPRLLLCDKLYRIQLLEKRCRPQFFAYAMASAALRMQFEATSSGASSSMQNIRQERLRSFVMAVPPLNEQTQIESSLSARQTASLGAEARLRDHIELLREYRQAVITAAVTGQLDVGEEAA